MRRDLDWRDVVDEIGLRTAPTAGRIDAQVIGTGLFPFAVISPRPGIGPVLVGLGLASPRPFCDQRAFLARQVSFAAMAADTGSAGCHDQATGARAGVPRTNTAPAAIEVPDVFVITART